MDPVPVIRMAPHHVFDRFGIALCVEPDRLFAIGAADGLDRLHAFEKVMSAGAIAYGEEQSIRILPSWSSVMNAKVGSTVRFTTVMSRPYSAAIGSQ